jgi:hypothetical protein
MPEQMRGGRSTLVLTSSTPQSCPPNDEDSAVGVWGAMAVVRVVQPGDVLPGKSVDTPTGRTQVRNVSMGHDHNAGTEGGAGSVSIDDTQNGVRMGDDHPDLAVPAGRSRILHDHLRRSSGLVRDGLRGCPRGGSRRMHTDSESVQPARAARLSGSYLTEKPLVIEVRVPLVMERRKRVEQ